MESNWRAIHFNTPQCVTKPYKAQYSEIKRTGSKIGHWEIEELITFLHKQNSCLTCPLIILLQSHSPYLLYGVVGASLFSELGKLLRVKQWHGVEIGQGWWVPLDGWESAGGLAQARRGISRRGRWRHNGGRRGSSGRQSLHWWRKNRVIRKHIDGLAKDCCNLSALALHATGITYSFHFHSSLWAGIIW